LTYGGVHFDGIRLSLAQTRQFDSSLVTPSPLFQGRIAGQPVQSALACAFLPDRILPTSHEESAGNSDALSALEKGLASVAAFAPQTLAAELEGQAIQITLRHSEQGSLAETNAVQLWLARDGSQSVLLQTQPQSTQTLQHWLFGPALIVALARRGIFCLHASAVQIQGCAYVLIGASGAGKSTLARHATLPLSDDICALSADAPLHLLSDFPQLKLAGQAFPEIATRYALGGFIAVRQRTKRVVIERQSERQLLQLLLQNTVAARLFAPDLLRSHLAWAAKQAHAFWQRSYSVSPLHHAQDPGAGAAATLAELQAVLVAA
jgi:hypothetical protein